jgi:signal transduction histidine kinase
MPSDRIPHPLPKDPAARLVALERENKQLRGELERVNQERTEYLQNVSHQLVAPLNAIKWHIENLTSNRIGVERAQKVLRSIYSQSTIAVHLAKNFALMSNLDADHALTALKEPLQEVNIFGLLVNLADDFQPLGWDKELKISVINGALEDAPYVLAMKPLISQAFSNIIENAVKYSRRGTEILVDGSYHEPSDTVSVTITNLGIPLTHENATRIFERGYRTDEARSSYPAGTGFGLYIAKRIIEIHEGAVSAIGDGTVRAVFEVVLPVKALQGKARQRGPKDDSPY